MAGIMTKVKDFLLGIDSEEEEYLEEEEYMEEEDDYMYTKSQMPEVKKMSSYERPRGSSGAGLYLHQGGASSRGVNNVVDFNAKKTQIDFCFPKTIEASRSIMESTQQGVISVVNLVDVDPREAQRIVDFVGGATYALGGSLSRINDDILLVVPSGVDIRTPEVKEKIKENVKAFSPSFSW